MKKVITYGTYDLLHFGHIRLLERAKELGDYLIVGVTSDDFDKRRGKINVKQSLIERIQAVKNTGLADEIIVEEYEGQKIDDIIKYGVDVFTVGSDWVGKFDYLADYCEVHYLPRTEGISSTDIRSERNKIRFGLVGTYQNAKKVARECNFVNGIEVVGICANDVEKLDDSLDNVYHMTDNYDELLEMVDAIYITSHPTLHYEQIKKALKQKKHVLCESPITLKRTQYEELLEIANRNNCVLMESLKTAYSTAYERLLLLIKCGVIGEVVSIDSTCTSLKELSQFSVNDIEKNWNSICSWGPMAMLPIFQILGVDYKSKHISSVMFDKKRKFDLFTKVDFLYDNAVASIKVGKGVKSEGELVISGTKGYVYVPAPWWKTEYFEIRFENQTQNQRYFYQLDGEGYRYELIEFVRNIESGRKFYNINNDVSKEICGVIEDFYSQKDFINITLKK